jgi:hypothetical protein
MALQQLGRPADRYVIESVGPIPTSEGHWIDGQWQNTTAIVREVCSLVKKEIEYLFSQLPSHERLTSWRWAATIEFATGVVREFVTKLSRRGQMSLGVWDFIQVN